MKFLFVALMLLSASVWSEEAKVTTAAPKEEASVESIVKAEKKERRKKVEMCHECGKPEVECECKGESHEGKEDKEEEKK